METLQKISVRRGPGFAPAGPFAPAKVLTPPPAGPPPRQKLSDPAPGGAAAPAKYSDPAPGGAVAPATNSYPAPGGAAAPANHSDPAPGGAPPRPPRPIFFGRGSFRMPFFRLYFQWYWSFTLTFKETFHFSQGHNISSWVLSRIFDGKEKGFMVICFFFISPNLNLFETDIFDFFSRAAISFS